MPDHRLNLRPGRCDFSETRCCETQSISTSDGTPSQRCHVLSRARRRSRAQIQRAGDGLFGKLCCGTVIFRGLSVFALDLSLEWRYAGAISCGTCEAPLRGSLWTRDRRAAAKSGNPDNFRAGALRLEGYLSYPELAESIELSWNGDSGRTEKLRTTCGSQHRVARTIIPVYEAALRCVGSASGRALNTFQ